MKARRGPGVEREEERSPLTVRIDQELRPIRFGFVVDPSDHASVLRAIEAATVTWGGRFCPLIPRFKRRRIWDDGNYIAPDAVMTGLVDTFEPDILVADDAGVAGRLGYPDGRVIHVEALLGQHFVDRLGLPMAFVYKALYEREFRFEQRRPRRLVNALPPAGASPLLHAAMFGRFPEDDKAHREGFHSLGGTDEVVVASAFMRTLQGSYTPLRLTSEFLDDRVGPAALVFVLDPTRVIDIIDYWNLRALGRRVVPLPIDSIESIAPEIREYIERNNAPRPQVLPQWTRACFTKSRCVNADAFASAIAQVGAPSDHAAQQDGVPRYFPRWARRADQNESRDLVAAHTAHTFAARTQMELASPPLDWLANRLRSGPMFAVSLRTTMYVESELARTLPGKMPSAGALLGARSWPDSIFMTSRGLVRLAFGSDTSQLVTLPTADMAMIAWLASRSVAAAPSNAGRLARQMQRILPTPFEASAVLREPVLNAFAKAARSATRAIGENALAEALQRVHGKKPERAEKHRERLIRADVIRPGMLVSCPHCEQPNWYAFDALEAVVQCERCVNRFPLPVSRPPNDGAWGFRLRGPFAVENAAQGAYVRLSTAYQPEISDLAAAA